MLSSARVNCQNNKENKKYIKQSLNLVTTIVEVDNPSHLYQLIFSANADITSSSLKGSNQARNLIDEK